MMRKTKKNTKSLENEHFLNSFDYRSIVYVYKVIYFVAHAFALLLTYECFIYRSNGLSFICKQCYIEQVPTVPFLEPFLKNRWNKVKN